MATSSDGKYQWGIGSVLPVQLVDAANNSALPGALSCSAEKPEQLEVAPDCSTIKVRRLGNLQIKVSNGSATALLAVQGIPQRHPLADAWASGGAGSGNAFAVVQGEGSSLHWGGNAYGEAAQLASSQNPQYLLPVLGLESTNKPFSGLAAIALGEANSLALTEGGEVWSWGRNTNDVLARLSPPNLDQTPGKVRNAADTDVLRNIVQVSVGDWNAAALTDQGQVLSWGWSNTLGRGEGSKGSRPAPVLLANGQPLEDVVQISVGRNFALALTRSGLVYGWGSGGRHQIGSVAPAGGYQFYATPVLTEAGQTPLADIVAISAGYSHSLALSASGQVWAWGDESNGALGQSTVDSYGKRLAQWVKAPQGSEGVLRDIVAVSASKWHSAALSKSGQVFTWGIGSSGQLGGGLSQGSPNFRGLPGLVIDAAGMGPLSGVVAIGSSSDARFALLSDGRILAWGRNSGGVLGQNKPGDAGSLFATPQPIFVKNMAGSGDLSLSNLSAYKNLARRGIN